MGSWDLRIALDPESGEPLFLQAAHALMRDIHRGRLKPGDPLPGYRSLAETLEVNRNTVLAAYQELLAEGWVVSRPSEGTFVAEAPPRHLPFEDTKPVTALGELGFDLPPGPDESGTTPRPILAVGTGAADPRQLPAVPLGRAYSRALRTPAALRAGHPKGHPRLRAALAKMLSSLRGLAVEPSNLMVTRGSQMGIFLLAQALFQPGDRVAVEALGSPRSWEALSQRGVELVPIPVDAEGLDLDALEAALEAGPLRAALVTPACQYPTTAVMSEARRKRLLGLALQHRFAILEHDYDAHFHYEGRPGLPLAAQDRGGVVVYVGSLSKLLAQGLPMGLVHGPKPLIDRLRSLRAAVDGHGDPILELAVAELMEDGELARHVNRMEQLYRKRRDLLVEALRQALGPRLELRVPAQGSALWAALPGVDIEAWQQRAEKAGVSFQAGRDFAFDERPQPSFRMGFTGHEERELLEAVKRMAGALGKH